MATPPTFVQEAETSWDSTSSFSTGNFSVLANDMLVAFAIGENEKQTITDISGGSLTWTLKQSVVVSDFTTAYVWTATVDADKTMSVSFTKSSGERAGGNVLTFRGSDGVGASAKTNASGAPGLGITTQAANSAIVAASGDWNAVDGATRTWRTVNSITPTAGNGLERTYFRNASRYTVYGAYYSDAGTAGAKTVGLSAPAGQQYSIVAVEVKGAAGAAARAPVIHHRPWRFWKRRG